MLTFVKNDAKKKEEHNLQPNDRKNRSTKILLALLEVVHYKNKNQKNLHLVLCLC